MNLHMKQCENNISLTRFIEGNKRNVDNDRKKIVPWRILQTEFTRISLRIERKFREATKIFRDRFRLIYWLVRKGNSSYKAEQLSG